MSNYYVQRSPEYLEHHGILGMKWGVRRYQNKDGSLTPEGRARYGDILTRKQMEGYIKDYNLRTGSHKKIDKNTVFKTPNGMYNYKGQKMNTDVDVEDPKNQSEKKTDSSPKKLSNMTDEELLAVNRRMQAEEEYKRHIAAANPKKVGFMKQFMGNLKDSIASDIPKGMSEGVKGLISNTIRDAFKDDGEKPKSETDKLKEEWLKLDYQKRIRELNNDRDQYFTDLGKEYLEGTVWPSAPGGTLRPRDEVPLLPDKRNRK